MTDTGAARAHPPSAQRLTEPLPLVG